MRLRFPLKKILVLLMMLGALVIAHEPAANPAQNLEHAQAENARIEAGPILADMLLKGPNAERYGKLAQIFFDDTQPLPARFFYEMALSLDGDNEALQKNYQGVVEYLRNLDQRFLYFSEQSQKGEELTHFGSMAAIKFHMGYRAEGLDILRDAIRTHGEDQRIFPLIGSFKQQIMVDRQTVQKLNGELEEALAHKEVAKAADLAGQMFFVTGGHPEMLEVVKRIQTLEGAKLNSETMAILEQLTLAHPQAVGKKG